MSELLALPEWDAPPRPLTDWVEALAALGQRPDVAPEGQGVTWLEVAPLRLRGYAMIEGGHVTAINFELHDPDPTAAAALVEAAARSLGWSVHEDDDDDVEDD